MGVGFSPPYWTVEFKTADGLSAYRYPVEWDRAYKIHRPVMQLLLSKAPYDTLPDKDRVQYRTYQLVTFNLETKEAFYEEEL